MDKRTKIIIIIGLCIIAILSVFSYVSTNDEIIMPYEFKQGTHLRTEEYNRTFDTKYFELEALNIYFLDGLYSDSKLSELSADIYSDYKKQSEFFSSNGIENNRTFNIYILDYTFAGGSYHVGQNIYCTLDDLYTGDYRIPLIQAYSGINQQWILYGVNDVIFNDSTGYDNAVLKEHYQNNDDISVLSLYGTRFYKDWNTNYEIDIAVQTSASLVKYILDNYSYDTLSDVSDQLKTEWLKSVGVDKEYIDKYKELFHNFAYSQSENYSMILEYDHVRYNLIVLDDIKTAKDIEEFVYKDITSRDYIIEYLKENVINNSHVINYDAFFNYYAKTGSYSRAYDQTIYINRKSVHLHEATHILIPSEGQGHWQYEGIAEYLSKCVYKSNYDSQRFAEIFPDILENIESGEYDIDQDDMQIMKCYLLNDGGWETAEDIDFRLYADSASYVTLFIDKNFGNQWCSKPIYERSNIIELARKPGDELSYAQALSFSAFLVEQYSLDTFINFCKYDASFKEVFNNDYITLKTKWLDYLKAIGEVIKN